MNKAQYQEKVFIASAEKELKANGIEPDLVDLFSMFDNKLTLSENKANLKAIIKEQLPIVSIDKKQVQAQQEEYVQSLIESQEYIYNDTESLYSPIYESMEKIKLGLAHFVMIKSRMALGKSFHVKNALKKYNLDYVVINNITSAYLFRALYENNNRTIWLKDCARIFTTKETLELLKNACETEPENRIVTRFNYSDDQKELPRSFVFSGTIVMDYNSMVNLKYNDDFQALKSRAEYIELVFSQTDMKTIMLHIAKTEQEKKITDWLLANFDFTYQFNLRHQQKAFRDYEYAIKKGLDWQVYLKTQLERNSSPIKALLYQFIGNSYVKKSYLIKQLIINGLVNSKRTAYRMIDNWKEIEELYEINNMVGLKPIVPNLP